ncbi:glycoside hydrolase family 3 C-terminal domain-containing protein [Streptomyces sp. NBC_00162]|uniref:glycoside hydrolase family 3 C-terminal domain-containing protein n=1 Tax=Streptomyces sp. NBC_00162 TaxID=2903629 RepID=UPI00214B4319|nr:glycoside hydrolase family 3 C-terminal domain-containing protein [Streptomyces sp. NBC_00162]UUU43578.1 glycoside hydrolase family 3 C-terminal domain-containing protein [Streptomyces sp. NBC_00162]
MDGRDEPRLDLRAAVRLLTGADTWRTHAEPAVGLREMVFSDGPAGVRGPGWDEGRTSVLLPSASALGPLWDEERVHRLGALLGDEARRKGVHVLLAPTLNLHRSPLAGRHFECFAEDPLLAGRTGAALIRGIQSRGVAATAKHYVANDSETERLTLDVRVEERVLHELYLAPFEAAVRAGVWVVMSAYNKVNGHTMTESSLLADPLKEEWGFDGVVVSDWGAGRSSVASAAAAQDLLMPGPGGPWGEALLAAVERGLVPAAAVRDKARRVLRLAGRVGALGPPAPAPGGGGAEETDARRLLREAAAASFVLLENRGVLPLDPRAPAAAAVIGTHADDPRVQGGGSSEVFPHAVVTPLAGLRAALPPQARLVYEPGPPPDGSGGPAPLGARHARDPETGAPGVRLRVLDATDAVLHSAHQPSGRVLEPELPPGAHTVELAAVLHPDATGTWTLGLGGFGALGLTVEKTAVLAGEFPPETDDPAVVHVRPPQRTARVHLTAGRPVEVRARRQLAPGTGRATVLTAAGPAPDPAGALAAAVAAAREADVAIVCVGTTDGDESEGHDRRSLQLPASQDQLVREIARAQPRTVVVVNAGGPVELPWRTEVAAVLLTWFPGQEAGHALADVLLGRAEPGGRLPTTWPATLADAPVRTTRPTGGVLPYEEGLHIGHRAWLRTGTAPAYWFGHGLGYTTWRYEALGVPRPHAGGGCEIPVVLRNTGARQGREVVQVHLSRPDSAVERPVRWLAGWAAVQAGPGERVTAYVRIPARALQHWSPAARAWVTEPGRFTVRAGPHAGELPLRERLDPV